MVVDASGLGSKLIGRDIIDQTLRVFDHQAKAALDFCVHAINFKLGCLPGNPASVGVEFAQEALFSQLAVAIAKQP